MAVGKEIRTQINSISSTRKITSAMEMVAASKMRRAQQRMARGKPYSQRIYQLIGHIASSSAEYRHFYMETREPQRIGCILVSTDRGLCGGLNINLFKTALLEMQRWSEQGVSVELGLIGARAISFFEKGYGEVSAAVRNIGESPRASDLIGTVKVMLDHFEKKTTDRLFLINNEFFSAMVQTPKITQLLPLLTSEDQAVKGGHWDYIYEPDEAHNLLTGLLTRYIESLVYQGVVENGACEQAARMVAMKNATENAGELISELQLAYNKERQAAITQELSEIVGGAAAV